MLAAVKIPAPPFYIRYERRKPAVTAIDCTKGTRALEPQASAENGICAWRAGMRTLEATWATNVGGAESSEVETTRHAVLRARCVLEVHILGEKGVLTVDANGATSSVEQQSGILTRLVDPVTAASPMRFGVVPRLLSTKLLASSVLANVPIHQPHLLR